MTSSYYRAVVRRVIEDEVHVLIRTDGKRRMNEMEQFAEAKAKDHPDLNLGSPNFSVILSLRSMDLLDNEPEQLSFDFAP